LRRRQLQSTATPTAESCLARRVSEGRPRMRRAAVAKGALITSSLESTSGADERERARHPITARGASS
jgi:hypothetical protein